MARLKVAASVQTWDSMEQLEPKVSRRTFAFRCLFWPQTTLRLDRFSDGAIFVHIGAQLSMYTPLGISAFTVLFASGCLGEITTSFPAGLEPLEEVTLSSPVDGPDGQGTGYPESVVTDRGGRSDYNWAMARGYVHSSVAQVLEALKDHHVVVDRREVNEWWVTPIEDSEYEINYVVGNRVKDIITVKFDIEWRAGVVERDMDQQPTVAVAVWKKVEGTKHIRRLEGSLLIRRVADGVTEVNMVEYLRAARGGAAPAENFLKDLYGSIVDRVHGRELQHR